MASASASRRTVALALSGLDREDTRVLVSWSLSVFVTAEDELVFIHAVTSPTPAWVTGGEPRAVHFGREALPEWVPSPLKDTACACSAFELDATSFTPVDAVLDFVQEIKPDVLLVGSRVRGPVASRVFFSGSAYLAEYADTVPVLVVRGCSPQVPPGESAAQRQVAIALDGSEASRRLVAFAARTVLRPSDSVFLMHSPHGLEADALLSAMGHLEAARLELIGAGIRDVLPMELDSALDVRDALVDMLSAGAPSSSFIVVGSRGLRGTLKRLVLGSVTRFLLLHAPCPVLVVPAQLT